MQLILTKQFADFQQNFYQLLLIFFEFSHRPLSSYPVKMAQSSSDKTD